MNKNRKINKVDESFEAYSKTKNIINHLSEWKLVLEDKVRLNPKDVISHGLISELELAINRLELLSGTKIFSSKAKIQCLNSTPDDYNYRLMCERGYKNREKWRDAKDGNKMIEVKSGTYVINS
ncbi:hypothetical protein H0A36_24250 [Endozoicomonas sp. SM1973]|uniref:Uncharacterized protein n=1 Tax=Spartinivicinus marinus TaxID=2994442 RepID=A0A853IMV2_9GAMM|nr:hypothetical protein [Spartinivicinus marinus]MCX4029288.1 hypothetical protein [Spartinivicinus marinus]NYZ69136.1 hypothetical protein [Spartinivicinus marinus]